MTGEERGLYRELLDACWLEGSLPADETQLRRVSGFEAEEWRRAWPRVSQEFETRETTGKPTRLVHRKVEEKRATALQLKADRAEVSRRNGAKGGRPKQNPRNPAGLTEQNLEKPVRARTPSPSPSPSPSMGIPPTPFPDASVWAEEFCTEYPLKVSDPRRIENILFDQLSNGDLEQNWEVLKRNLAAWKKYKWADGQSKYIPTPQNWLARGDWAVDPTPPQPHDNIGTGNPYLEEMIRNGEIAG